MARVHFVKKARKTVKDTCVKEGEPYYWWKFRFGGKHFSTTPPRRSQLTQSDFFSTLYDLEDRLGDLKIDHTTTVDDIRSEVESVKEELENLVSETEDKLNNMPDSLQQGPTGELLQERIDGLGDMIQELDALDYDDDNKKVEDLLEEAQGISYSGG